jgi:hypothetical protein
MLTRSREVLDVHAADCGDRVLAFVLHPADHEAISIVELWGIPVLGGAATSQGRLRLLCESTAVLIPPFETVKDVVDQWAHHHPRVVRGTGS